MGKSEMLEKMKKASEEERWKDLKKEAEQYALDNAMEVEGYLYAGEANMALEDFEEADYFFSMAQRIDGSNPNVALALARLGLLQGSMSTARHNFKEVLKQNPNNVEAVIGLGDCAYLEEDYMGSIEDYTKAISSSGFTQIPQSQKDTILFKTAHSYQLNKQLEDGLVFINTHKGDSFKEAMTLVEIDIYKLMGPEKNDELLACMENLYKNVSPVKAIYLIELAQLLNVKGDTARVEALYTELLGMDLEEKTKVEAHYSRASLRTVLENYKGALEDYDELLKLKQQWYYFTERAEVHIKLKNAKGALSDYNEAIKLQDPPLYDTIKGRGELYMKAKSYDKAIADFTRMTKINPSDSDGYFALAGAFRAKKETDKAFKMYLQAELQGSLKAGDILANNFAKQVAQMRTKASAGLLGDFEGEFSKNANSPMLQQAFGKLWVPDMNKFILGMGEEALKFPATVVKRILDEVKEDMLIITPQGLLYYEGTAAPLEAYYKIEVESEHAILLLKLTQSINQNITPDSIHHEASFLRSFGIYCRRQFRVCRTRPSGNFRRSC